MWIHERRTNANTSRDPYHLEIPQQLIAQVNELLEIADLFRERLRGKRAWDALQHAAWQGRVGVQSGSGPEARDRGREQEVRPVVMDRTVRKVRITRRRRELRDLGRQRRVPDEVTAKKRRRNGNFIRILHFYHVHKTTRQKKISQLSFFSFFVFS